MQNGKFTAPKTKEEFLERAKEITERGAQSVSQGIQVKLKRVAGPLMEEKEFFDSIVEYHRTGEVPERYSK